VFKEPEEVNDAVAVLKEVIALLGLNKLYKDGSVSKVEVFPQHNGRQDSNDKCLLLPYYNTFGSCCTQKVLHANRRTVGSLDKALAEFARAMTSVSEIRSAIESAPYADAPHCIQTLLLQGALAERDYRNNFIFAVAMYMKIKYKEGFFDHLLEANALLKEPLTSEEVLNTCNSVMDKDYPFTSCCKKEPCKGVCNKARCKERQYGVGRQGKDNYVSNVGFQQLIKVNAEKPYYKLLVIKEGTTEAATVTMDGAEELLSQDKTQLSILEQLNVLVETVKRDVWEQKVKDVLQGISEEDVAFEEDNSEPAIFLKKFYEYLVMYRIRDGKKRRLLVGSVWRDGKSSFFTSDGVNQFYTSLRRNRGVENMHNFLVKNGCIPTAVNVAIDGKLVSVSCWRKDVDRIFTQYEEKYGTIYTKAASAETGDLYGGASKEKEAADAIVYDDELREDEGVKF
jgi:hypothetical protein